MYFQRTPFRCLCTETVRVCISSEDSRQWEGRRLTLAFHFNYKLIEINSLTLRVSIGLTSYTSTKLPEPMNDVFNIKIEKVRGNEKGEG